MIIFPGVQWFYPAFSSFYSDDQYPSVNNFHNIVEPCQNIFESYIVLFDIATKIEHLFLQGWTSFCVVNSLYVILTWITSKNVNHCHESCQQFFFEPASVISARLDIHLFPEKKRKRRILYSPLSDNVFSCIAQYFRSIS